ncbi:MAG: helix-turn-helix transcriptional regulator [Flavobacteriales bacterium]|nr:helix-turn-helix transcriptional regulator [Flavobacteriales bacterium]MCB9192630.1 helix-turn-helix transcriptional regulator [Flavobacteriales bacterium]
MKKKDVPQDDENLFEGKFKVVKYAIDDDGNYGTVGSVGWEPENTVLNQAWEEINKKVEETKKKIESGELSPLAYHMEKNIMDVGMLSQYMDISKRKVAKHLEPSGFNDLDIKTLEKYAEVFDISVDELKKTE